MDQYITIKKKKEQSLRILLLKISVSLKIKDLSTIETKNRFDRHVEQIETSDETTEAREEKPPPIYVKEMLTKILIEKISNECDSNYHVCPIKKGNIHETKFQVNSVAA